MIQQTSIDAYHTLTNISDKQRDVFDVIYHHKGICNLEIAYELQRPVNQITGRTNELVEMGVVEAGYKAKSPITGRTVIYWTAK